MPTPREGRPWWVAGSPPVRRYDSGRTAPWWFAPGAVRLRGSWTRKRYDSGRYDFSRYDSGPVSASTATYPGRRDGGAAPGVVVARLSSRGRPDG
ncbi:hypothetical protein Shyd_55230 [Streptomyces hydrogenans]|uniref:Uncharacterized protein n=1 Tax=Streptomyces hydrogenans TaxID=1873719 RepID=A0ABQ3PGL3_9ACTN|nr:hypothetical protein GCM10018784_02890 [Streptomyces hydrogenans]GHI24152.1 hypothetical protein Shyd_55230 [Streptomyces hydrogenans]